MQKRKWVCKIEGNRDCGQSGSEMVRWKAHGKKRKLPNEEEIFDVIKYDLYW